MSSHTEPFTRLRPTLSAKERHDRPEPDDLVCTEFGQWGFVAADVWLWQTGDTWSAQEAWEIETWWDDRLPPSNPALSSYPVQFIPNNETDEGDYHWWSVDESDVDAILWNTAYVAEVHHGIAARRPAPEKVAIYYVVVARDLHEGDHSQAYVGDQHKGTDGTYESCVKQLAAELQEGWDAAGIAGFFHVAGRKVLDSWPESLSDVHPPGIGVWPQDNNPA